MICKKSKSQLHTIDPNKSSNLKYFHILNPNLNQEEFSIDKSNALDYRQLTLKNLIVFLMLLLLTLFAVYRIVRQLH